MCTSIELTSINRVARYCGVGESTLADFMAGRAWPSILPLAQIEISLSQPIWPVCQHAHTALNTGVCGALVRQLETLAELKAVEVDLATLRLFVLCVRVDEIWERFNSRRAVA